MINIPTDNNNPGDIKTPTGSFATNSSPLEGQAALYNDLTAKMTGKSIHGLTPDSSLVDFARVYDGSKNDKDNLQYAANLANQMGVSPDTKIGTLLPHIDQFARAVANNEGYKGKWSGPTDTKVQNGASSSGLGNFAPGANSTPDNSGLGAFAPTTQPQASTSGSTPPLIPPAPTPSLGEIAANIAGTLTGANAPGKAIAGGLLPLTNDYKQAQASQDKEQQSKLQLLKAINAQNDPTKKAHLMQAYQNIYGKMTDTDLASISPSKDISTKSALLGLGQMGSTALLSGDFEPAALDIPEAVQTGKVADTAIQSGELAKGTPSIIKPAVAGIKGAYNLYKSQPLIAQLIEGLEALNALKSGNYKALGKTILKKVVSSGG